MLPENVIKNVFGLTNQFRETYKLPPLRFSKDLSFLAGEHACNMSTKRTKFGHAEFEDRRSHVPTAIAFSENIAVISESEDPAQDILVSWISRPTSLSRILSSFTHTGIGVSESDDGKWYCCQIFARLKKVLSRKEALLVVGKFANRQRAHHDLPPLALSYIATSKILKFCSDHPQNLLSLTQPVAKTFFTHCHDAEIIIEGVSTSHGDLILTFFNKIKEKGTIRCFRKEYNHIAFLAHPISEEQIACVIILAKCGNVYGNIPRIHAEFPDSYRFLQLLNDYRAAHNCSPLPLSQRLAHLAHDAAKKLAAKEICNPIGPPIAKSIMHKYPGSQISCGVACIQQVLDIFHEIMVFWTIDCHARSELLMDAKDCGFAFANFGTKNFYIVRLIGTMPEHVNFDTIKIINESEDREGCPIPILSPYFDRTKPNRKTNTHNQNEENENSLFQHDKLNVEYFCLTDDDDDKKDNDQNEDASLSFKLTN